MRKMQRVFVVCISLLLIFPGNLLASDNQAKVSVERVVVTTPVYEPGTGFDFPKGRYEYTVSWQGIPAASATVEINSNLNQLKILASAKTYSGIDLFYKLRYHAEGIISADDFSPIRTSLVQQENSRRKVTEISFLEGGEIDSTRDTGKETTRIRFNPNNFTLDPFSAAFLARSLSWEPGISREFDTFNGKTRYLIRLTCTDLQKLKVNGQDRDVWVITPEVTNLSGVPKKNSKLRRASIYVTADKEREIIKLVSDVFIGSVTTKLDSFTPFEKPSIQIAGTTSQQFRF